MPSQTITVTVNVSDPTDADAVAFLVPYNADRNVTAPQKRQWCMKGSSGADYLTTGTTSLTCVRTRLHHVDIAPHKCMFFLRMHIAIGTSVGNVPDQAGK